MAVALDRYDHKLLQALQKDARSSLVSLSEQVNLSPSQCARRLQRLEQSGVIRGYRVDLDPQALGLDVVALVNVTLVAQQGNVASEFIKAVAERPEIVECLQITGDGDYQVRVMVPNLQAFSRFLSDQLMQMPGVSSIRSSIQLSQLKPPAYLPLPAGCTDDWIG